MPSYGLSPASMPEGFQRASGKPFDAPAGAYHLHQWGWTRRLRRGWRGCRPEGGQYFLSKRKKVPKKARGTATTGKRLLLPILTAGLAMSRAFWLDSEHQRSCALLCSPFSAVKMGGPFSLRCLSPLCSPAVGAGQTQIVLLEMLRCGWVISRRKRPMGFPNHVGLYRPTGRKPHQTGEPQGLSPSGGNSAAKLLSLEYPRAPRARCGVQGVTPCREPEGLSPDGGLRSTTNRKLHQTREPWHQSCHGGNCSQAVFPRVPTRPTGAVWGAGGHPLPRAAMPVAEWRPWGRMRREREALRRAFPKRHTYLYSPARQRRAVRG